MGNRVGIVGVGMTKFVRRALETGKELSWLASKMALDSCGMTMDQIDCVALGTAPDSFDGVHMKGEYLSDGAGCWGKPYMRAYVGGGTGVFSVIQGWYHVASGMADVCLVICEEKMSTFQPHAQAAFLTIFDQITERPLKPNLLWIFALEMNRYMTKYGLNKEDIARVAVKNKNNALDHPSAQIAAPVTIEDVLNSEVLAWPVQRLDVSPVSDGAVAVILANESVARRVTDKPVWIEGCGWALDTAYWTNRDLCYPRYVEEAARMAYKMAGVTDPRHQIHVAEPYDPFDYKELQHLIALGLANVCDVGRDVELGKTAAKGKRPVNVSGGALGMGHMYECTGLARLYCAVQQLRGEAGMQQLDKAQTAVVQAWRGVPTASAAVLTVAI